MSDRIFNSKHNFDLSRLPGDSFLASCECGGARCDRRTIDFELLEPTDRVLAGAPMVKQVRTFIARIEGDPVPCMLIVGDRMEAGEAVERIALVSRLSLPGTPRPVLDERTMRELIAPFWNSADEIAADMRGSRAVVLGPPSTLTNMPMPDVLRDLDPEARHA